MKNDGGPAFPSPETVVSQDQMPLQYSINAQDGMSLRDWFAGQALIGLMMRADIGTVSYQERAEWADRQADAMLARRAAE